MIIADFKNVLFHIPNIFFRSSPFVSISVNKGIKTPPVAAVIIPTIGICKEPFEKSAKTSAPQKRLIKNWSAALIPIPAIPAKVNGNEY